MGIMQAELQDKRQWVSKERFVEGLSLVNMLPGATAAQLSIFLGYARGGWWGGLLGGLCFVLPGFFVLLALTVGDHAAFGVAPVLRGALYGLGPVVMGIYLVAVYRLGEAVMQHPPASVDRRRRRGDRSGRSHRRRRDPASRGRCRALALPLAEARRGRLLAVLAARLAVVQIVARSASVPGAGRGSRRRRRPRSLLQVGAFLLKVGALTFGGGLTMIAFMQEQVVSQFHWLTPQEFLDGLALGQFNHRSGLDPDGRGDGGRARSRESPGPGSLAARPRSFRRSSCTLPILPALDRVRKWIWTQSDAEGIAPAVIGVLAVSLVRLRRWTPLPRPFCPSPPWWRRWSSCWSGGWRR